MQAQNDPNDGVGLTPLMIAPSCSKLTQVNQLFYMELMERNQL
jgi:hypothetical protein